jgi:hypothetical protein
MIADVYPKASIDHTKELVSMLGKWIGGNQLNPGDRFYSSSENIDQEFAAQKAGGRNGKFRYRENSGSKISITKSVDADYEVFVSSGRYKLYEVSTRRKMDIVEHVRKAANAAAEAHQVLFDTEEPKATATAVDTSIRTAESFRTAAEKFPAGDCRNLYVNFANVLISYAKIRAAINTALDTKQVVAHAKKDAADLLAVSRRINPAEDLLGNKDDASTLAKALLEYTNSLGEYYYYI